MKALLSRVLAAAGLTTLARATHADNEARRAIARAEALETRGATLRAEIDGWKVRHEEKARDAAAWKQSAADAAAKAAADNARLKARAEDLKARMAALTDELRDARTSAEGAHSTASSVREELMLFETKLDLIEAAIQVLDARTRESVS